MGFRGITLNVTSVACVCKSTALTMVMIRVRMQWKPTAGHTFLLQDFPLHGASKNGDAKAVWQLLQSGHNPEIRSHLGLTAYQMAANKETRDSFRRFRAQHPEKWNYKDTCIPSPLTPEMEADKKMKKVKAVPFVIPGAITVDHLCEFAWASSHPGPLHSWHLVSLAPWHAIVILVPSHSFQVVC